MCNVSNSRNRTPIFSIPPHQLRLSFTDNSTPNHDTIGLAKLWCKIILFVFLIFRVCLSNMTGMSLPIVCSIASRAGDHYLGDSVYCPINWESTPRLMPLVKWAAFATITNWQVMYYLYGISTFFQRLEHTSNRTCFTGFELGNGYFVARITGINYAQAPCRELCVHPGSDNKAHTWGSTALLHQHRKALPNVLEPSKRPPILKSLGFPVFSASFSETGDYTFYPF